MTTETDPTTDDQGEQEQGEQEQDVAPRQTAPVQEILAPRELEGPEYVEVDGEMVPNYDLTIPAFEEGDVVSGRVVRIDKDEVLVDIGYKSEGVVPLNELSIRKAVNVFDEVSLGEEVDALVMQKEDPDGRLILSKKRARFEKAWKRIEAAAEAGENVEGTVIEVVKGGLILDLGVRGFLPASLVDIRRVQDLDDFLGRTLECRVIELNRNRNNVVLSRRAVLEDERREVRQRILDELQPGAVVEGVISNIVDFGAFVDLEGIDGLIHISELSWSHVNHPSEVIDIGQTVQVKVLDIDRDRQRISLGLKQTQADPWQDVIDGYDVDDVVEGKVTKVVTFGAFVEIHAGVEGLVHISELATHHVENPREVVNQGDTVAVRIIEIDGERRRLSLSLKRVADGDEVTKRLPPPGFVVQLQREAAKAASEQEAVAEGPAETEAPVLTDDAEDVGPDAVAVAEAPPEVAPGAVAEAEADAEAELDGVAEVEPQAEVEGDDVVEAEPQAEVEPDPEPEAEAQAEVEPDAVVEAEPEAAVEAEPEAAVAEAAVEAEPEGVVEAEPEAVVEAEPEAVVEAEPEAAVEAEPEAAVEAEPEAVVEAEPEAVVEAEPEAVVEAEPEAGVAEEAAATGEAEVGEIDAADEEPVAGA
jgi:small subunit ribosomal protein S1